LSPLVAATLGIIQGLTEFLPVSSSAHLIIARDWFGVHMPEQLDLAFDVACHVGTLVAVLAFFWADLLAMLRAVPQALSRRPAAPGRRIQLIVAGTIPIVIVGALGGAALEDTLRTPAVAAAMLAAGAIALFVAERSTAHVRTEEDLTMPHAVIVGVAQAAALIPGVSRSGATIAAGMLLGYKRREIARFTFLLSIPAILAAAAKKGLELRHATLAPAEIQAFAIAMLTSGIVGYVTIKFFLRFLANHRLDVFAWYRLALAALLVVLIVSR
jgi:undecaprenyl-diphosphatase